MDVSDMAMVVSLNETWGSRIVVTANSREGSRSVDFVTMEDEVGLTLSIDMQATGHLADEIPRVVRGLQEQVTVLDITNHYIVQFALYRGAYYFRAFTYLNGQFCKEFGQRCSIGAAFALRGTLLACCLVEPVRAWAPPLLEEAA